MSLSWPEPLRIGLCPDRLVVAGYRGLLRRRPAPRAVIPVEPAPGQPPWQAAVEALPAALAGAGRRRPALTLVLSHHFVRYALLPWHAALNTEAAWSAYARHRLVSIYGPAAEGWALRVSTTAPRSARIACATDQALLDALQAKLGGEARLASVQPHLMAAFNRVRAKLRRASCWLVVEEAGCLALALIERGAWRAIRSRRVDERWRAALPELLGRESALLGLEQPLPPLLATALD